MTKFTTLQKGRSMVEMLGVLAIIGVLSVGGLAGYSMAMSKYKTNKSIENAQLLITNIRTLYGTSANYDGLTVATLQKTGVVTNDMCKDDNCTELQGQFGDITVEPTDYDGTADAFTLTFENVPDSACVTIATGDWGGEVTGLLELSINGTAVDDADLPMSVADATTACDAGANTIAWTYR